MSERVTANRDASHCFCCDLSSRPWHTLFFFHPWAHVRQVCSALSSFAAGSDFLPRVASDFGAPSAHAGCAENLPNGVSFSLIDEPSEGRYCNSVCRPCGLSPCLVSGQDSVYSPSKN